MGKKIADLGIVQRSVVLVLLSDDHDRLWTFNELHREIYDAPPDVLRHAIRLLEAGKVIETTTSPKRGVWATEATRYLDSLEMVCI
jgi:hypothetical protein